MNSLGTSALSSRARLLAAAFCSALLLLSASCGGSEAPATNGTADTPSKPATAAAPKPITRDGEEFERYGDWVAEFKPAGDPASVKKGDGVFAVVPNSIAGAALIYATVESVDGNTVKLSQPRGPFDPVIYENVPVGYLAPAPPMLEAKAGDTVSGAGPFLGSVKDARPNGGANVYISYDEDNENQMFSQIVDYPYAFEPGPKRYGWVLYTDPDNKSRQRGVVLGDDGDRLLVSTSSGHAKIVNKSDVEPMQLNPAGYQAGDDVRVWGWVGGVHPGKIVKVEKPGLLYTVRHEFGGNEKEEVFFYTEVLDPK